MLPLSSAFMSTDCDPAVSGQFNPTKVNVPNFIPRILISKLALLHRSPLKCKVLMAVFISSV